MNEPSNQHNTLRQAEMTKRIGFFGDFKLFVLLGLLGAGASYLSVNIPHTKLFMEIRWAFGFMAFALLRRWWLAVLLAGLLSITGFHKVPLWVCLVGNMSYILPSLLVIRLVHHYWLKPIGSLVWYGVVWALLVMAIYQIIISPLTWLIHALLEKQDMVATILWGWQTQPYLLESLAVAVISSLGLMLFRSDHALRTNRRQLSITLDSIGDGVIATDTDGRVIRMNPLAEEMTGWSLDEARGRDIREVFRIFNAITREPADNPVKRVLEEGRIVGLANHTILIARYGRERQIADSAAPIREDDGRLIGTVMVFRDVTETHRVADNLRKSEARYTLAQQIAGIGTWEWDIQDGSVYWSPGVIALFGVDETTLDGSMEAILERIHPDDRDAWQESVRQCQEEGKRHDIEFRTVWPDGSVHWIRAMGDLRRDDQGRAISMMGVSMDITHRKQAELALRQTQRRYREIFEGSRDGFVVVDLDGRVIDANQSYCRMLGYTLDELKQLESFMAITPESWRAWEKEEIWENRLMKKGYSGVYEKEYIRKDGTVFAVELQAYAAYDENGQLDYFWGVARDVSDRNQARAWLRESEQRYRLLAENTLDVIWQLDMELRFTYINPAVETMLGYTPQEFVGTHLSDHCDPHEFEQMQRIVRRQLERLDAEPGTIHETHLRHRDGTAVPVEIHGSFQLDDDGQPVGLQGTARNITQRKQAEDAYTRFCEMATELICVADLNTATFLQVNPAFQRTLGYTEAELLGQPFLNFVHPDDLESTQAVITDHLQRGDPVISFENRYRCKDGSYRWLDWNSHPLPKEGRTYAIAHDVTDRKRAEQERRDLEEQFRQSQKMEAVGQLAGGIAHDFNNMLQTILGYTEILIASPKMDPTLREDLQAIRDAARHSADLTRQLLAYARRQTISPRVLDLNDVVGGMLKMFQRLIGEGIDLHWQPGEHVGTINMDPAQVDQILANLVVNARDAINGVGTITIRTDTQIVDDTYAATQPDAQPGDYVRLTVSDDGVGIDPKNLKQIFEPYFTTKQNNEGTGLGLSTVYGIVRQNQGFVEVISQLQKGTTFRIYLPRYDQPSTLKKTADAARQPHAGGHETILVIEDEPALLQLCQRVLEQLGYQVLVAGEARTALQIVRDHPGEIHLLISDVVMADMSGHDLCVAIQKIRPDIPCLFMSGYTENEIAHHGVLEEGIQFIQKPFSVKSLAEKIRVTLKD